MRLAKDAFGAMQFSIVLLFLALLPSADGENVSVHGHFYIIISHASQFRNDVKILFVFGDIDVWHR